MIVSFELLPLVEVLCRLGPSLWSWGVACPSSALVAAPIPSCEFHFEINTPVTTCFFKNQPATISAWKGGFVSTWRSKRGGRIWVGSLARRTSKRTSGSTRWVGRAEVWGVWHLTPTGQSPGSSPARKMAVGLLRRSPIHKRLCGNTFSFTAAAPEMLIISKCSSPNIQTSLAVVKRLKLMDSGAIHLIGNRLAEAEFKK